MTTERDLQTFATPQSVANEFKKRGLPDNFCHVPFSTLILEPDGHLGSCRNKGTEFVVGDLQTQTLEEVWNGPVMRQWRREFLDGQPVICKTEVRHMGCHLCPRYNSLLPKVVPEEIQSRPPIRLALNLNGRCNLECQMCHIWQMPNGFYDRAGLWGQIERFIEFIQEVELLSGEPFIQKDTYRLIDLISRKNPECRWVITTNGHWRLNDHIRAQLDRIRLRDLIMSIDSLNPDTYAKIRKKGDLSIVLANLDSLIEYDQDRLRRGLGSLNLRITFLIQRDNWRELGEFHEFAKAKKLEIFRTFLYEPEDLSLLTLPVIEREQILETYVNELSREQLLHSRRTVLPLLDSLPVISRARLLMKMRDKLFH